MALLSGFDQLAANNNTFSDWLNKTNEIILMVRGDTTGAQTSIMTANSQTGGSQTYGNATLFGQFTSNTLVVMNEGDAGDPLSANTNGGLRGGNWNFSTNTIVTDTLYIVSNTTFTDETVKVNVDSTYGLVVQNTIDANGDVLFVGNGGSNTDPQMH